MAKSECLYPFRVPGNALEAQLEGLIDTTIASLSSFYLDLPRGTHFVNYDPFRSAYEQLRKATNDFTTLDRNEVKQVVETNGLALVVLRCIVGLSPPELADLATETQDINVGQGFARAQDQKARDGLSTLTAARAQTVERIHALIDAACDAIERGPERSDPSLVHRLEKVDTERGLESVHRAAKEGIEYPMLLYERLLGRPFASHRDSVSEKVGDIIEDAIEAQLKAANITYHKSARIERIVGFDQAPDFLVPNTTDPKCVIEAKLTQDDGTARDKVTRVQHLDRLSEGGDKFEVVACIDGRGFKIRREDMRKLIVATRGKVFSMATINHLVDCTSLKAFAKK